MRSGCSQNFNGWLGKLAYVVGLFTHSVEILISKGGPFHAELDLMAAFESQSFDSGPAPHDLIVLNVKLLEG